MVQSILVVSVALLAHVLLPELIVVLDTVLDTTVGERCGGSGRHFGIYEVVDVVSIRVPYRVEEPNSVTRGTTRLALVVVHENGEERPETRRIWNSQDGGMWKREE